MEIPPTLTAALSGAPAQPQPHGVTETATGAVLLRRSVSLRTVSLLPANLRQRAADEKRTVPVLPQFADDDTITACHMPDNALSPWIKAGCLIYTSERREPVEGDLVLLTYKDGRSAIRLLSAIAPSSVTLSSARAGEQPEEVLFGDIESISYVVATLST